MQSLIPQVQSAEKETPGILLLQVSSGLERIQMNTIVRIEAASNYSKIYLSNGRTLVVAKVLAWFEDKLPESLFIRIHRSHIIGLIHVQAYSNGYNSRVVLQDNTVIDVSRRKKSAVMKVFRSHIAA